MSDHNSDAVLQPDMHLKPLDNSVLIKPLRSAAGKSDGAPVATRVEEPPVAEPPAAFEPFIPDEDEDDLFAVPTTPLMEEEPEAPRIVTPAAELNPGGEDPDDLFAAPETPPAEETPMAPKIIMSTKPNTNKDDTPAAPETPPAMETPAPPPPPPEPPAKAAQADEDADDDLFTAPVPPPPAEETPPAPPADDEDDDELFTESKPSMKASPPPPQPKTSRPPEDNEDDDLPDEPAPRPAATRRTADDQMHMMELMKTIFNTALNAGLPKVQPPKPPEAQPAPQPFVPVSQEAPPSMNDLRKLLITLQQKIREAGIPVVIVIEGLSASGKGMMLSKLNEGLDSRGYKSHPIREPNCVEKTYPAMWRYWTRMPAKGNIALFCSSWYGELNKATFDPDTGGDALSERLNEIISMESQLVCDGTLMLKFFLHISRQEQYDRLKKMASKKSTSWQVVDHDLEQNKRFDEYMKGMDDLMSITNLKGAPWHVLDSTDLKACARHMIQTVIRAFEGALNEHEKGLRPWDVPMLPNLSPIPSLGFKPLKDIDPDQHLDKPYKKEYKALKKKLYKLQVKLYRKGIPMIISFEGWDAAGKGGAIRRLNAALDARGFTVVPISAPTPIELSHHYMWRFWTALPPKGHVAIFDRTWYGRVMVERIEKLCTEPQWQRAFEEINRFEKLLVDDGAIVCKFWLQIDPDTQLARFNARKSDPEKQWKLTDEDWRNRDKWPAYKQALEEVLQRTHTAHAPWTVVEADDKDFARIKVLKTVVDTIEKRLKNLDDEDDE